MRLRPCVAGLPLVSLVVLASPTACSSSSATGSGGAEAVPTADGGLAGEYVADDAATSPFRSITIVDDTRYLLQPTTCPDANDCRAQGWYTVVGDELALHDDAGDAVQTFPLSILASGTVPASTDVAADAGDHVGASVALRGAAGLVTLGSRLLGPLQVFALQMGPSSYHLVDGAGRTVTASNAGALLKSTGPLVGSSLLFEGSCRFLHDCSSFSKKLPAGEVSWGCVGVKACSDTDRWMAGPSRAYCGKTVTVCHGTQCTSGQVLDVSNAGAWEGSEGLLAAIGLPYELTGACSGAGGGMVTIRD